MPATDIPASGGTASRGRILFADDDVQIRSGLGKYLMQVGFDCDFAGSAAEAIELLRAKQYDALLSDINMPGNSRLELIESLPAEAAGLPVILLTGEPTVETAARSVGLRVMAYLTKPPKPDELVHWLTAAVAESRNSRTLNDNRQRLQEWDREIERIQQLLQQTSAADRHTAMRSYLRLTVRQLVVSLIELEHLLVRDGGQLGTDQAVEKQHLLKALQKAVNVLHKTRDHFKSKELGELRKELEALIGAEQSSASSEER